MSLVTQLSDLATRIGTEFKAVYGKIGNLASLTTTAKSNLVSAINEVNASVASASGIDDTGTSTTKAWSSSKTSSAIASASTDDRARGNHTGTQDASTVNETATRKWLSDTERTKLAGVAAGATANATDAQLRDRATHTGTQGVSTLSDFTASVDARVQLVVGAAPAALDTLVELGNAIGNDANYAATVNTALGNRVRVDGTQSLTAPQQAQARTNIGAASSADVGDVSTLTAVATFEAALV